VIDFVASLAQRCSCRSGNAGVEKNSHEASGRTAGSTRSWPTSLRA
jgi:hypothetical protein